MAAACLRFLLTCLLALAMAPAQASSAREVTAEGGGSGRDEAIADALLAGLRQSPALAGRDPEALRALLLERVRREAQRPLDRSGYRSPLALATDGMAALLRDYEVLAVTRREAGSWSATVRMALAHVAAPEAARRVHVLLLPFSLQAEDTVETGAMEAQAAVGTEAADMAALQAQLGAALAGRGAEPVPAPADDVRLGLAFSSPASVPWSALAAHAGNDAFVAVEVQDYLLEFQPENLRKRQPAFWKARFLLAWQVLSAPGAVVQASGLLRLDRGDPALHAASRVETAGRDRAGALARIGAVVTDRLAQQLAERLLPAQVLATRGDLVELDTGALVLRRGDALAVMGAGTEEHDEGAARPVLREGPRIAVLETLEAGDGRARARLLRGDPATVLPGAPVRRLADLPAPRLP